LKTKLIIIGGFLGAGKTTLLKATAQLFHKQGEKVGLICNDQAEGLVDTKVLSGKGLAIREIAGSCFCCDFNGFIDSAYSLRNAGCTIILAEPVGSCTDLSATLIQPIKYYHNRDFDLAPLSVLVDPIRLKEKLESGENTESGSGYIYLKQLEEADYLVINKLDLINNTERASIDNFLKERFQGFPVKWISALNEEGMETWLNALNTDTQAGTRIAEVDYDVYAKGEAMMGWYNAEFILHNSKSLLVPWAEFNLNFLQLLRHAFIYEKIEVAHLKTFLKSGPSEIYANLTGTDREPSVGGIPFSSTSARIMVNMRAETTPNLLNEIMEDIISLYADEHVHFQKVVVNYLKPGRPVPTYRHKKVIDV
jgi:Ni2+-binding GTPase involved in maturation of urease and hydrogenase